jgi:hypothetical protein
MGGLCGMTFRVLAERERIVFDWARARGVPVAFALAGGYTSADLSVEDLVRLHRLTIVSAMLANRREPLEPNQIKRKSDGLLSTRHPVPVHGPSPAEAD